MNPSDSTMWWLITGALVAFELLTGTFYMLMLALGAVGGAVAAHLGLPVSGQIVSAAVIGGGAVAIWHFRRSRQPAGQPASSNPDVNIDIGSRVHVAEWRPDGSARVSFRGADWDARHAGGGPAMAGEHRIRAIEGNCLLLERQ